MSTLLRSLKDRLGGLLAPAEDPRVAFATAHQRQVELLLLARQALGELATTRAGLQARMRALQDHLPQLHQQARQALAAGREDTARLALRRRLIATAELNALAQHVQELQRKEQALALHEERLAAQVEAFQARLKLIAASYSAAEAQLRLSQAITGVSAELSDLGQALKQAERQTEDMQARASAIETLIKGGAREPGGQPGAGEPLAEDAQVEAELAALRRELGQASLS
jgi:phage shock protein A